MDLTPSSMPDPQPSSQTVRSTLKLPGGEGGLLLPYLMPPDDEVERFARGLLALNIPELDDLAMAAGLA